MPGADRDGLTAGPADRLQAVGGAIVALDSGLGHMSEPHMTKLAPIMSALFPDVVKTVERELKSSNEAEQLTRVAEAELGASINREIDNRTRRVIIQGIMTDILYLQMQDSKSYDDWRNWNENCEVS